MCSFFLFKITMINCVLQLAKQVLTFTKMLLFWKKERKEQYSYIQAQTYMYSKESQECDSGLTATYINISCSVEKTNKVSCAPN